MKKLPAVLLFTLVFFVTACTTPRAVRVNCDGTLESINAPEPLPENQQAK